MCLTKSPARLSKTIAPLVLSPHHAIAVAAGPGNRCGNETRAAETPAELHACACFLLDFAGLSEADAAIGETLLLNGGRCGNQRGTRYASEGG